MKFAFSNHLDSGKFEKRVLWWPFKWYVPPTTLEWGEWEKEEAFFKKNYPVQYFFRETVVCWFSRYISHKYTDIKYNIKGWIKNPRKEMRDNLFPIRLNDLTDTIVNFHLEAVIEMVDREKCFEIADYNFTEEHKEFANSLKECHYYAKVTRPALLDKIDKAYDNLPENESYEVTYKEINKIESEIEEYDTKVCEWVIKNRKHFWC